MFFIRNLSFLHRAEKLVFSVEFFHECSTLAYVCVQYFSDFSEAFSNFEKSKSKPGAGAPGCQNAVLMRMLLNIVKGCTSFKDSRTVNGVVHTSYKAAWEGRGYLDEAKSAFSVSMRH